MLILLHLGPCPHCLKYPEYDPYVLPYENHILNREAFYYINQDKHTHERICNSTKITGKYLEKFNCRIEFNLMKSYLSQVFG
jgi:hypothetical protein